MAAARTGFLRNMAYRWSHMLNNVASAVFGFIFIALWQAVAPAESAPGDPYNRATLVAMMVLAQCFAWMTVFLPAGLGIHNSIRSGNIALELARPAPFFPLTLMREVGNVAYQAVFRSGPLVLLFALTVGFPKPASWSSLLLAIPSLLMGSYIALTLFYTVGMSALWTTEIRWAHWTYHTVVSLFSGGWIPADMLPGWLGKVAPFLPFASQQFYPVRVYLGMSGPEALGVQAAWVLLMTLWCQWLTRSAFTRVEVQGG